MGSESREILHDIDAHPVHGTGQYWRIGFFLFVLTGLEIGAYYMERSLGPAATPVILALSAAKFILVVMFFMHLKYDSRMFTGIFLFPMALATLVISSLIVLYHILHPMPR
jgi:cytochrome c oxidase subunit IV